MSFSSEPRLSGILDTVLSGCFRFVEDGPDAQIYDKDDPTIVSIILENSSSMLFVW